jgi:uncharacterized protein YukE
MSSFIKLPGGALGANIEQMTALASHLNQSIEQLENVFKTIDNKISATTWSGNDASQAETQWQSTRQSTMNNLRTMLDSMSQAIKNQSQQQQQASS